MISYTRNLLSKCYDQLRELLNSKYSSDVVNPLHPSLLLRHVERSGDEVLLVILNLNHLALNGLVGDELVDEDRLGLAQPVDPVEALPLAGRVPGGVQQQEVVGSGEVESDTSGLGIIIRQSVQGSVVMIFTRRLSSITLGEFCPVAWKTLIASALSWRFMVLNRRLLEI